MASTSIRNLLFDLGNVIMDIDIDGAIDRLLLLGKGDQPSLSIDKILLEYETGRISTDVFVNSILRESKPHVQAIDVIEAWNSMLIGIPEYRLDMLRKLRQKFNVYLLSNTNALHLEWIHKYLKRVHDVDSFEKEFFDETYYSHLVGDRKPMPSIFKHIMDDAMMNPSLTLFMDDVQENLAVAKKLGFKTHLVKPETDIAEYLKVEGYY
ncbi:MAG: HAD family phosphatase [Bacteroidota bacterium]|nr:HAD family phosphatase [Bacteroidota bacterium]